MPKGKAPIKTTTTIGHWEGIIVVAKQLLSPNSSSGFPHSYKNHSMPFGNG
jgi:hypothetical protein